MQRTAQAHPGQTVAQTVAQATPIHLDPAPVVSTADAARHLLKSESTMRRWGRAWTADPAADVPLRPVSKIGNDYLWATFEVCALMGQPSAAPAPMRVTIRH